MTQSDEAGAGSESAGRREVWQRVRRRIRGAVPFVLGVAAALLGMALYSTLTPRAQPLTVKQVNTVVAEAMASATPPPAYSAQVYRVIQPSLVLIQTNVPPNRGQEGNIAESHGLGSGVVISDEGAILTALHVVKGASEITVTFADGTETSAAIALAQPENDIAVLQPEELPEILVPAVMGNPNALRVGDEAFAFGNPFGLYGSLSTGVVSGLNRSFQRDDNAPEIENLIQFDTAVNPGNSGGPLLNRYGHVVGIVVALLNPTDEEFFVGIGFAVPITTAAGGAGAPAY